MPEDDDLNFPLLALSSWSAHGRGFTTADVARLWLDELPAGRTFTAERVAYRNLLAGVEPPETARHRNPFREWIGALIRADVYGWTNPGDPAHRRRVRLARRPPHPHRQRRLRGDVRRRHVRQPPGRRHGRGRACAAGLSVRAAALPARPGRPAGAADAARGAGLRTGRRPLHERHGGLTGSTPSTTPP